jgi:hypothetical protein
MWHDAWLSPAQTFKETPPDSVSIWILDSEFFARTSTVHRQFVQFLNDNMT